MNEIKYIYFDIKYVKGVGETEPTIKVWIWRKGYYGWWKGCVCCLLP